MKLIATRTTNLGGRDFTDKINDVLVSMFEKEYKPINDMTGNMQVRTRYDILQKAKKVKHDLATGELDEIVVELKKLDCDEDEDEELPIEFSREQLLEVIDPLLKAATEFVDEFFSLVCLVFSSFHIFIFSSFHHFIFSI